MDFKRKERDFYLANRNDPEKMETLGIWTIVLTYMWVLIETILKIKHYGNKHSKAVYRRDIDEVKTEVIDKIEDRKIREVAETIVEIIVENGNHLEPRKEAINAIGTAFDLVNDIVRKETIEKYARKSMRRFEVHKEIEELTEAIENGGGREAEARAERRMEELAREIEAETAEDRKWYEKVIGKKDER